MTLKDYNRLQSLLTTARALARDGKASSRQEVIAWVLKNFDGDAKEMLEIAEAIKSSYSDTADSVRDFVTEIKKQLSNRKP